VSWVAATMRAVAAKLALWASIAIGVAWVAIRLLGLERGFPLVPLIAYTPYAALAMILVLALALLLRHWIAAAAAAAVLAGFAVSVLPRAVLDGDRPDASGPTLTLMTANLMLGQADPERIVELVREHGVDVLSVQELTPEADAALRRAGLAQSLPEGELTPIPGSSGAGIYSRLPLLGLAEIEQVEGGFVTPRALVRVPGGGALEVVSAHPRPPTRYEVDTWQEALERLPPADPGGRLRALLGDFNATIDHEELRDLLSTGYTDAAAATGSGLIATWPADGFPPPVTIDHALVDSRIEVLETSVHDLPGSDHRAVVAEVAMPGAG
jgi:endonuclease/exonuclease/phosphatase family metal-dependent hydrolase